MAEEIKDAKKMETLNRLAFQLFTERSSRMIVKRNAEALALNCYRDAEVFLVVSEKVRNGELTTAKPCGPQLANCCAPNLKPTHPLNLVSQRFGNLDRVREIHARLTANPTLESLPELDWGKPEVNTARTIFPAYATAATTASN